MNTFHTFLCFYCWLGAGVINYFVIYFDVNTPSLKKKSEGKEVQNYAGRNQWGYHILGYYTYYLQYKGNYERRGFLFNIIVTKTVCIIFTYTYHLKGDLKWTPDLIFRKNNANRCKCVIRYWDISRLLTWIVGLESI